jgi:hypothetical protein
MKKDRRIGMEKSMAQYLKNAKRDGDRILHPVSRAVPKGGVCKISHGLRE